MTPIALDNEIWALSELFPVSTIYRRRVPQPTRRVTTPTLEMR